MFKDLLSKEQEIETIIGPSVKVEGDFTSQGDVRVEGRVNGSLKTESNLTVGGGAKISANVSATNALIAGKIKGNVKVKERLELTDTSKISGDVEARILIVAEGAQLNGKCAVAQETPSAPVPEVAPSSSISSGSSKKSKK